MPYVNIKITKENVTRDQKAKLVDVASLYSFLYLPAEPKTKTLFRILPAEFRNPIVPFHIIPSCP